MRDRVEHWLNGIWYGGTRPPKWLRALAPVYRLGFLAARSIGRERRPPDLRQAPILVVGNITAGGSGKTPLVIRLCRVLQEAGLRPGVVSRGYRGRRRKVTRVVADSPAAEVGDEAVLIARRTGLPVAIAADRCAAARALLNGAADVIVADDGLQHHRLPRSLEICVIDAARGFGNGRLLPAGPMREPAARLRTVDYVVLNTADPLAESPIPGAVPMQLAPGLLRSLSDKQSWRVSEFVGCRANAIAGISNPERFFEALENAGIRLNRHAFPDHHRFRPADFRNLEPGLPLIMTEKDAVKCRGMRLANAWYLSIEAGLPAEWEAEIVRRVTALVRQGAHG